MLIFRNDTMEDICFHAQSEYPKECCGILLGKHLGGKRIAHKVIRSTNMMLAEKNTTQFSINPMEVAEAELQAEEEGLEIVGFYHSHPDYEAVASEEDKVYMITGYSYPIVSVKNGKCVNICSFEKTVQSYKNVQEETVVKE